MGGSERSIHDLISLSLCTVIIRTYRLSVDSGLEKLNTIVGLLGYYLLYVEKLASLVEPVLLSDRYSWAFVSVSVSLKTFI